MLYYRFPDELRRVIKESRVFARLQTDVMFALSSKYGLALYEMIQKRGNPEHIWFEDVPLDRLRALPGVPPGKLTAFFWRRLAPGLVAPGRGEERLVPVRTPTELTAKGLVPASRRGGGAPSGAP